MLNGLLCRPDHMLDRLPRISAWPTCETIIILHDTLLFTVTGDVRNLSLRAQSIPREGVPIPLFLTVGLLLCLWEPRCLSCSLRHRRQRYTSFEHPYNELWCLLTLYSSSELAALPGEPMPLVCHFCEQTG